MSLEQAFIKHLLRAISHFKPRECSSDGEALLPWSLVLEEERQQAAAAPGGQTARPAVWALCSFTIKRRYHPDHSYGNPLSMGTIVKYFL